jgi:hypothetical protein
MRLADFFHVPLGSLALLAGLLPGVAAGEAELSPTGQLADPALDEVSGLAVSRRAAGVYWAHNDSFGPEVLYAIRASGEVLARVRVRGAPNLDWEDLASFELDGQSWLALADIGNNLGADEPLHIYVLPEPSLDAREVAVHARYRFRYRDGPRDAEGLAVDVPNRRFLIADKGRRPAGLYALPMQPGADVAERIADMPLWPEGATQPAQPIQVSWRAMPTALDLSADGLNLLLLTYRHIMAFRRAPAEDWAQALKRPPRWARLQGSLGYEAAAWSEDAEHALITYEGVGATLIRWQPAPAQ